MKSAKKCTALFLALTLSLTVLTACGEKEPIPSDDTAPSQDQEQNQTQQEQETPALLSDTIYCSNGETTLRFAKDEQGQWQWKDDATFPLDTTYVDALAACAEQMLAAEPVTTEQTLEDLDLDSEEKYVTVTDEKGVRVTWYLGDKDDKGCHYMRRLGDEANTIYMAPAELTALINRSIYDMMILPQLPAVAPEYMRSITVTTAEKTVTTVPNSSGVWVVGISSVNEIAQPMVQALSKLQIASCVDFNPTSGAAAICGLEPPKATVDMTFVSIAGVEGSLSFSIGAKLGGGYCVTLSEDSTIYLVNADVVEPVLAFVK